MIKQFSLTKLMIALAITLQVSAVFADKDFDSFFDSYNTYKNCKDFDDLYSVYEGDECFNSILCSDQFKCLIYFHLFRLKNPLNIKETNKYKNNQIRKLRVILNESPSWQISQDSKAGSELAIKTYKKTPLEDKTETVINHFYASIKARIEKLKER